MIKSYSVSAYVWIVLMVPWLTQTAVGQEAAISAQPQAATQSTSPNDPALDWSYTEVVVVGRPKGPATWHFTKGKADLWLIGTGPSIKKDEPWDDRNIQKIIAGASDVSALYANVKVSMFDVGTLTKVKASMKMPRGKSLSDALSVDDYKRFEALASRAAMSDSMLTPFTPFYAANNLQIGTYQHLGLIRSLWPILDIAKANNLKVKNITPNISYKPIIDSYLNMTPEQNVTCLQTMLDELDYLYGHYEGASAAWASGDLAALRANYSDFDALCPTLRASGTQLAASAEEQTMLAIKQSLGRPGKHVFLIPLSSLLRNNGILDRIKTQEVEALSASTFAK